MFQHYWPEENECDSCGGNKPGAMLYIGNIPVSFICQSCAPEKHNIALDFAHDLADEEELNGWDWVSEETV